MTQAQFQDESSLDAAVGNLQKMFDVENFLASNNLVTKKSPCEAQERDHHGTLIACQRKAIFQHVEIHECPQCEHCYKDILLRLCIPHALERWGQGKEFETNQLDLTNPKDVEVLRTAHAAPHETASAPPESQYPIELDESDPTVCVCGWFAASTAVGHDRRHAEHLEALNETATRQKKHASDAEGGEA